MDKYLTKMYIVNSQKFRSFVFKEELVLLCHSIWKLGVCFRSEY